MGTAQNTQISGAKGGSGSVKTPVEASDSLRSTNLAKILIAVGEGEFEGTPTDADIYLDNTPLLDASGNVNFPNVKWEWRHGTVDQPYIPGIPAVENETTVNVELHSETPWVRSISNTQLSAVRVRLAWPALQKQDDEGNVGGYRIEYAVDIATDGGAYQTVLDEAVDGKTTTRYERSRRIDLPPATSGWQIRVRRLTANQNTNKIADSMLVEGYTEVIDAKLRYPNTALLYMEFDAEQFSSIPAVTVRCKARKWPVPTNYDPIARTYSGVWDGTFKQAWTNNPAWVTFGICTEDRFGLGKRIKSWMVDKWELFRIAQYCDQSVPDGAGGSEPRFLCDMNLQGKADAWSLLRDISGIYRGMTYWAQGQLIMQADMPRAQDYDYVFTRANVIDGSFSYGSASAKTRYTRALVSYDNPDNNYDTDVIAYSDLDLQRRFGDKPTEISAIGCTRASEAQRRGKWVVMSNNQDRTVSFTTGMEGQIPLPGHIIPIGDSLLAGREVAGRITAANDRLITLDRDTQAKAGDRLIINLPGGQAEGRTVQAVNGRALTVTTAYSEPPAAQLQWALDADDLAIPLYRVLKVARTAEGNFDISALQYQPDKYAHIDTGARLEEKPISVIPISVVPAPSDISLTSTTAIAQGLAVTTLTISWPAVSGAVGYDVEWRKDSGNWIKVQRTGANSVDVVGIYAGSYVARVRAVSAFDVSSVWTTSVLTALKGKEGLPPAVTSLVTTSLLFGIGIRWTFPAGAEDTQRTELWYGPTPDLNAATKLSDLAFPQNDYSLQSLKAGAQFFFWARLVDRTGNMGPWYPQGNGVVGQASAEAAPILELIAGQIGDTELGQGLRDEIGRIPGLQDQLNALDNILAYSADKTYVVGDTVQWGQRLYQATQAVPRNTSPPDAAYWVDIGQVVKTVDGLAQQVTVNTADISDLDGVITSHATELQALRAATRVDGDDGSLADALNGWKATATIAQETKVRTSENEAFAQRLTTLDARLGDNSANISELEQVVADNQSATASQLGSLAASIGNNASKIEQTSTAYADTAGKLSTMWSVKMQVNANGQYVAAGFGLGIENTGTELKGQFIVSADRFAVVNSMAGGVPFVPFAVQNGQVFMNSAFIQDGSITNAKIGESLQSEAVNSQGVPVWRLGKSGVFEMNGDGAGFRREMRANYDRYWDQATGFLVIEIGELI
ncbi:phage tail protein [Pseudomonas sp. RIT-To-2]|uniref:phage tail protein n=1 Tax=Pseudomonas sp. RIT-To-2 TaxID=3462541 RepID=UPI00241364A4